jgi:mono/diheme cytochrome c family protein
MHQEPNLRFAIGTKNAVGKTNITEAWVMQSESHQTTRTLCVAMLAGGLVLAALAGSRSTAAPPTPQKSSSSSGADSADERGAAASDTALALSQVTGTVEANQLGQQLYSRHCAACHGAQGDGQGTAAAFVFPRPRNFQAGRFRLVSTANNVPLRDDLHAVLLRGMPGSSMPPWGHLPQVEREALVDEVMRLRQLGARASYIAVLKEQDEMTDEEIAADDVQQEIQEYVNRFTTPGETTVVPEMGAPTEEAINRAKVTYANFGCLQCHGSEGKGDGVQAMIDEEGISTAPRDFTLGIFKGGADPGSLYRRIAYGMPGTPMPSSTQMKTQQMIDLVH